MIEHLKTNGRHLFNPQIVHSLAVGVEAFGDVHGAGLFPEEEEQISTAIDKRRREYTTTRHCARLALGQLGIEPVPLPRDADGAPVWPSGVVGSMTHCVGYRLAVVGFRSERLVTIGVDAEPHEQMPSGVLDLVSLSQERAMLAELTILRPEIHWDRLLFSAKEAIFKAWFPVKRMWLGFEEVAVWFDPQTSRFTAQSLVVGAPEANQIVSTFEGRFLVSEGLLLTAVIGSSHEATAG